MLLALIWEFDFPPFMVLIIAILNDGMGFFCQAKYLLSLALHLCVVCSACTYNDI
jgi:hypothetical protein